MFHVKKLKQDSQHKLHSDLMAMWQKSDAHVRKIPSKLVPSAPPAQGVSAVPTATAVASECVAFPVGPTFTNYDDPWWIGQMISSIGRHLRSSFANNTTIINNYHGGASCHEPSCSQHGQDRAEDNASQESEDRVGNATAAHTMFLAIMGFFAGVFLSSLSWLLNCDWQYRHLETVHQRFSRGTQRLQTVMELCISIVGAVVAWRTMDVLLPLTLVFSGLSRDVFLTSMLLQCCVLGVSSLVSTLGFLATSVACVAFLRWYHPFGTGNGLSRYGHKIQDMLQSAQKKNAIVESMKSNNRTLTLDSADKSLDVLLTYRLENIMLFLRAMKKISARRNMPMQSQVFAGAVRQLKNSQSQQKHDECSSDHAALSTAMSDLGLEPNIINNNRDRITLDDYAAEVLHDYDRLTAL